MDLSGKKILVVGGGGFIGSTLVDQLCQTDVAEVVIYDNFVRGSEKNLFGALKDPRVSIFADGGDILRTDLLNKAMENKDGVFHLAALWLLQCQEYPRSAFDVNVKGTFNVIEAAVAQGVEKVVFSSSASVYGDALEVPMTEDHAFNNRTFYGATKIAGEQMFLSLGERYNLDWVGLRYMNVYGPRQDYKGVYVAVMMRMLDRIDQGLPPLIYGDGSQEYDFVYVEDVARANLCAMRSGSSGRCYNVGRGVGTSLKELTDLLLRLNESGLQPEYRTAETSFVTRRVGCIRAAKEELGFHWEVDLEEGMRRLIEWRSADKSSPQ